MNCSKLWPKFWFQDVLQYLVKNLNWITILQILQSWMTSLVFWVLSCNCFCRWEVLWAGKPNKALTPQARQFSPSIKQINFATNLLRLEVNSSLMGYYTELDAVILRGVRERPILALYKIPVIDINDLSDSEEEISDAGGLCCRSGGENRHNLGNGYFDRLPYEVSGGNSHCNY